MVYYTLVKSPLGEVALVWRLFAHSPLLVRVIMPDDNLSIPIRLQQTYPEAQAGSHPVIAGIGRQLETDQPGEELDISLCALGPQQGSDFYRRVWMETSRIPYGKVCTYGELASRISHPRAARAVGTALAANPFPLLIPCHRVIRSEGELGNYSAGGPSVKRRLLEREGLRFDERGRVILPRESTKT